MPVSDTEKAPSEQDGGPKAAPPDPQSSPQKKQASGAGDFEAQEAALKPPSPYPRLVVGAKGQAVGYLQQTLNTAAKAGLEPDGSFGGGTQKAVVAFQKARGLTADGVVGSGTWDALEGRTTEAAAAPGDKAAAPGDKAAAPGDKADQKSTEAPKPQPWKSYPMLFKGYVGPFVKKLQTLLTACGHALEPTGNFDDVTRKTLKAFQQAQGLKDDGVCGGPSWEKLFAIGGAAGLGPAEKDPPDPRIAALISGKFAGKGQYKATGDGFLDGDLDALLTTYGQFWRVDVRANAPSKDPGKKGSGGGGGIETAGGAIDGNPAWVETLQSELYTSGEWTQDHEATQQLLRAYLNAWSAGSGGLNSTVEEFYRHIGGSEENGQAAPLGGSKGAMNWCQEASTKAVVHTLLRKGLRFKTGPRSKQLIHELQAQVGGLMKWQKGSGGVVGGKTAWEAELRPGDMFSLVGSGPLTGHAATAAGQVGNTIMYVSGNAGGGLPGNGAVKAEQVKRGVPPPEYAQLRPLIEAKVGAKENMNTYLNNASMMGKQADKADKAGNKAGADHFRQVGGEMASKAASYATQYGLAEASHPRIPVSREDGRFVPGLHGPKAGEVWVVSITRTSRLDANALLMVDDAALAKEGLERCDPVESAYPDWQKVMGG